MRYSCDVRESAEFFDWAGFEHLVFGFIYSHGLPDPLGVLLDFGLARIAIQSCRYRKTKSLSSVLSLKQTHYETPYQAFASARCEREDDRAFKSPAHSKRGSGNIRGVVSIFLSTLCDEVECRLPHDSGISRSHDLLQLAQSFGVVQKVVMLRAKNQALLQMTDIPSAVNVMQYYTTVQPSVRSRNVYMQFSSHQELTTPDQNGQTRRAPAEQDLLPNRILLITIHNPLYPITVDVLHQVFSPHGFVEKIVTFQKSAGLQALLQYGSQLSATQARNTLQGRNIYDGCCTLDIQFSNLQELQVNYNNERTRDFTNAALPSEQSRPGNPGNNIMSSLFGEGGNIYNMQAGGPRPGGFQQSGGHPPLGMNSYQVPMGGASAAAAAFGGVLPPGITGTNDRSTLLVSNLVPEKIEADKLFNLFSNYGNIVRIKILHNKPDHALIQMGDGFQAELAFNYLKGVTLFGKRMDVNFSKHAQINPSPDTSDFSSSPLNRFNRNAAKNYRYCCAPTKMIHVSSLPADIAVEDITSHLSAHGTVVNAKIFESNGKKQALVLFESEEQATEALVCKHASQLQSNTIRLAFSKLASV